MNIGSAKSQLIGHWKLAGDTNDASGNGHHGRNEGVDLSAVGADGAANGAARFDGRRSRVIVPDSPSLQLGTEDFTLCAGVFTEPNVDDSIGDIITKFDAATRRGFNLGVKRHSAACNSLANDQNLHFGIDNGQVDPGWGDCGRPGNAVFVMSLVVHDGDLYAGTFERGAQEVGHVWRYVGGMEWQDLGSPDAANAVMCLASFDGKLYAGTGRLKAHGSALPASPNQHEGGHVYCFEGDRWVDCGKLGGVRGSYAEYCHDTVHAMEVFGGRLYAIPLYTQGLFRYEGGDRWTDCGSHGARAVTLGAFRDDLYVLENGNGIMRFESGADWTRWTCQARLPGVTQIYSMAVYEGKMVVGTWPEATVFGWEEDGTWTTMGRLGDELEVMGMAVYNGKLYAGTLPLAQVYRYDGDGRWTCTGQLDTTPDVQYRRAWSTAIFQGKLYYGTLPSGKVYALEAGRNATCDRPLAPGWRHLAAVRSGGELKLYINGEVVGTSSRFDPAGYDLSNGQPLWIGFGQHDYFCGSMADVRLYRGALSAEEITTIAGTVAAR
jgi:hypothetical protein